MVSGFVLSFMGLFGVKLNWLMVMYDLAAAMVASRPTYRIRQKRASGVDEVAASTSEVELSGIYTVM